MVLSIRAEGMAIKIFRSESQVFAGILYNSRTKPYAK